MENVGQILPLWSVFFFVLLLLSIAILPLTHSHFWERNRNKAIVTGILSVPVVLLFLHYGFFQPVLHEIEEYFSFIILLASLFIISGGIFLGGDILATPKNNTILLALGALIANLFGTTGAAMLLIGLVLRTNSERKFVSHIPIFFIFIVCNIGGMLTPLADPPLFMGYLRGVPFFWTLRLLPHWLFANVTILVIFYFIDCHFWKKETKKSKRLDREDYEPVRIYGKINLPLILGILASVVFLKSPLREGMMIALAVLSLIFTPKSYRQKNHFNYTPIIEVAVLFAGIFITMVPVLLILQDRGAELGVRLPWHFFWTVGGLSSLLDNTPTYVTFLSVAQGLTTGMNLPQEIVGMPINILESISVGAVCMGALTYIGNGPNFMVKAICEHRKVKMPSFFGYLLWSSMILLPVFITMTFIFFV